MSMGNQMNMKNNHKTARDITGDHVPPQNRDTPRAQYREDSRNYRKHSKKNLDLIGQIMQNAGIRVIPTVSWAEQETYAFCFDGLPQGGNVAVSTVGVMCDKEAQRIFRDGMAAMIEKVRPALILMYGKPMPEACGDVPYKSYENDTFGAQFAARVKARKEK